MSDPVMSAEDWHKVFAPDVFDFVTLLFVGLKLTHVITWSWWWVLVPLWGPWAVLALLGIIALIVVTLFKV